MIFNSSSKNYINIITPNIELWIYEYMLREVIDLDDFFEWSAPNEFDIINSEK